MRRALLLAAAMASSACALVQDFDGYSREYGKDGDVVADSSSPADGTVDTSIDTSIEASPCGDCVALHGPGARCVGDKCTCAIARCPETGDTFTCTTTDDDPLNCGTCGFKCGIGQYCRLGKCVCNPGSESCGGECVDPDGDFFHCGCTTGGCSPGHDCRAYAPLSDSMGTYDCTLHKYGCGTTYGRTECEVGADAYSCVRIDRDEKHCGDCNRVCARNELCIEGNCRAYRAATECDGMPCTCGGAGEKSCPPLPGGTKPICITGAASCPI